MLQDSTPDLADFLTSTELFRGLDRERLRLIARKIQALHAPAGEVILKEGDQGAELFLIVSGEIEVAVPNPKSAVRISLGPGQSVGEVGFLTGLRRSATASAATDAQLFRLSRDDFDEIAQSDPNLHEEISQRIVRHLRRLHLSTALRSSDTFGSLGEDVLIDMELELEFIGLTADDVLFHRGDPGNDFFFVVNGRLRVSSTAEPGNSDNLQERVVAELGPGDTVGEMAVLTGETRAATVSAVRDSQLARLSRQGFQRLVAKHPSIVSVFFTRKLANLMRSPVVESRSQNRSRTFAVVGAGSAGIREEFCPHLAKAMKALGSVCVMSSQALDEFLGRPGVAQASDDSHGQTRVTESLNQLETEYSYLLYQSDVADSAWTRRCLRQADHILVIADSEADPIASGIESGLLGPHSHKSRSLVLLYRQADDRPHNTLRWLKSRPGYGHHHVRANSAEDFSRLARLLTGHAVGLVLSGGFARGIAHAGVIRAMQEAHIPIDLIGGTSMGAIVGALYAAGRSPETIVGIVTTAGPSLERDITIPFVSLNSGKGLMEGTREVVGEIQIEDLWFPFFCVSASLTSQSMRVHTHGSLLRSTLASARAPGIYPPIVWDNELLVDGGIVNNLPVDVMKEFANGGLVIAVDCSSGGDQVSVQEDYGLVISGVRTLLQRMNPFAKRIRMPSIFSVLMKTILFGGKRDKERARKLADLYLQPPIQGYRFNDFRRGTQMAEDAYQYTKPRLTEWWVQTQSCQKKR